MKEEKRVMEGNGGRTREVREKPGKFKTTEAIKQGIGRRSVLKSTRSHCLVQC